MRPLPIGWPRLRRERSARALVLGAALLSGCALAPESIDGPRTNACSTSSDCGGDAVCAPTVAGEAFCTARSAKLGAVILEVRSSTTNESFVFYDQLDMQGSASAGLVKGVDLSLPPPVAFRAAMPAPEGTPEGCMATDGTVPLNITLHQKADFPQFRADIVTSAPIAPDPATDGTTARAEVLVNPGLYDVHLTPTPIEGCEAQPAPRLYANVAIVGPGPFELAVDPTLDVALLTGNLTVPVDVSLEGWTVEVVDPEYGDVVSTSFSIPAPEPQQSTVALGPAGQGIPFFPVSKAVLRLRSPDGNLMVHFDLGALDLDSNNNVEVDLRDLVATPMPIHAHVNDASGGSLPNAQVKIQSVSLTGSAKANASFNTVAVSDDQGNLAVSLVPGEYAVTILPDALGNAAYFGKWVVGKNQGGDWQGFELASQPTLEGTIVDALGNGLASTPIQVTPVVVSSASAAYFELALGEPHAVTRQFGGVSDADGGFSLELDPGRLDLSVRPPAASGFPWRVVPSLVVEEESSRPVLDLGEQVIEYPVIAQGHVGSGDAALSLAVVRAWVIAGTAETGQTLIQIGETHTDESGNFVLPLPPQITLSAP